MWKQKIIGSIDRTISVNRKTGRYWDVSLTLLAGSPGSINLLENNLSIPLQTKNPKVFKILDDLFHPDVPERFIDRVLEMIAACPQHTFIALTRHAELMEQKLYKHTEEYPSRLPSGGGCPPNLWPGVTIERSHYEWRFDYLLKIPAKVYVISLEPLSGPVSLRSMFTRRAFEKGAEHGHAAIFRCRVCGRLSSEREDDRTAVTASAEKANRDCEKLWSERLKRIWVIAGGECGHGARPAHPDWFALLRDECIDYGVPFLLKTLGNWSEVAKNDPLLPNDVYVTFDGDIKPALLTRSDGRSVRMRKAGRFTAGRMLGGRKWNGTPSMARKPNVRKKGL